MKEFHYIVKDPLGIHARPAGLLVKEAKKYPGHTITITKGDATVNALRLMGIMQLAIKQSETVRVCVEGEDEANVIASMEEFFKANL